MVYILLVAALITGILTLRGEHMLPDTIVILGVVILNVILGFFRRVKRISPGSFRHMIVRQCLVVRDGDKKSSPPANWYG
jgi:magnesium-transporting ATPase (P-type)